MKNYLNNGTKTSTSWNQSRDDFGASFVRISQVKKVSSYVKSQKLTKLMSSMTASQIQVANDLKNFYMA
jgi:hypothetical protein